MIELIGLTKRYGNTLAVDDLSLTVAAGEIFGFLGPERRREDDDDPHDDGAAAAHAGDGAARRPRPGDASRLRAKQLCGFVPDRPHVYEKLTGAEFLDFVADLYHVPAAARRARGASELLRAVRPRREWATELVESYSHGMKQRLVMAAALIHAPRMLIVDEPMVGMDPRGARLLKRIFRQLAADGVTVFMSTHSLEVAEETCDRIGIINDGRLIALGTVDELRRQAGAHADSRLESDLPAA